MVAESEAAFEGKVEELCRERGERGEGVIADGRDERNGFCLFAPFVTKHSPILQLYN